MLKLFNCIFLFLGINQINIDNFTDMKIIFDDYDDVKKKNNKICYKIFISLILLIKPIYFFYEIIQNNNKIFYATMLYLINVFVNYIIFLKYFDKNYFEKILFDFYQTKDKRIKILLNDKLIPLLIIFISILTVISELTSNMLIYKIGNNSDFYNNTNIYYFGEDNISVTLVINILVGLSDIYGYILILSNVFIFFIVFLKHTLDLKKQVDRLMKKYSWSKDTQHTEVSTICYEIMWVRNELENSIEELEPLFVSNTLLGAVSLGFIIEYKEVTIYQIISLIYWSMSQIIYFIVIYYINNYKNDLMRVIKKPKFVIHYIRRKFNVDKFNQVINNINIGRHKSCIENEFEMNEVKIDISSNGLLEKISDDEEDINIVMGNENKGENKVEEDISINEYVVKNSSSIDWIILNTILNENWACFEFFGFEFNGANNLKSTIGITALLIVVTKWFLELNII